MNVSINYQALYESAKVQRDRLLESEVMLMAAVRTLNAEIASLKTWDHPCKTEHGVLKIAKGEPCSWCGATE